MHIQFQNDYQDFLQFYEEKLKKLADSIKPFVPDTIDIYFLFKDCNEAPFVNCDCSPFGCNPSVIVKGCYWIAYNTALIQECRLTKLEQYACVCHEIGHILYYLQYNSIASSSEEILKTEEFCDSFAKVVGLTDELSSALHKMEGTLSSVQIPQERFEALNLSLFVRPEWTCGKYNEDGKCAIMYNLIEGLSYFFEDYSALVISKVLSCKRWQLFSVQEISNITGISVDSINEFFELLVNAGLLTTTVYDDADISNYRKSVITSRNETINETREYRHSDESLGNRSEAEELFLNRTSTCGSVMFELTYRCSEKCIHCYNPGASRNKNEKCNRGLESSELAFDDYKAIIDDLYENGLFKVCLTGGDPFSKSFVWDIIDYLYEKEIAFDVFTNGLNLYGREAQLAKRYPRSVGISIYSMSDAVHDGITRVQGSLKKSVAVARRISEYGIPEYIKCCVTKANVQSYYSIYAFAKEIGAKSQVDVNASDSIDGDKCVRTYLKLSKEQYEIVLRDSNTMSFVDSDNKDFERCDRLDLSESRPCKAGIKTFNLSPQGDLMPCCALHYSFGNLKQQTISEIIQHSPEYKRWLGLKLKDFSKCLDCKFISFCSLCPGFNYAEHKSLTEPSYDNCYLAQIRAELYDKLKEGNDPIAGNNIEDMLRLLNVLPPDIQRVK